MRRSLLPMCALAAASFSGGLTKFSAGAPAQASAVNDNFTYLDTTKASKATVDLLTSAVNAKAEKSALDGKAEKSDLATLQAKVKADSSTLAANGLSMASVNSNLAGLRDTVGKKKDSAWIMKSVTPAAIGALPASGGTVNALAKWTNGTTLGVSGITDDGSTISLNRKTSLNGLMAMTLAETPSWNSLYGAQVGAAPTKSNYAFSTRNDNYETNLNSNTQTILQVGMKNILRATIDGVTVDTGTLTAPSIYVSGTISSAAYVAGRGAKDDAFMGSYFRVSDSRDDQALTKSWMIQLGASNTLDFWKGTCAPGSAGCWNRMIQFLPNGSATFKGNIDAVGLISGGSVKVVNALDVGGDIQVAGSLKTAPGSVKSSDVADYVFEPSYKLTSLPEVEAFTKEHKHLPEVPSATEIERGGLDLAQMNLVLLKKVEELTLHAIEQQKAIEQQRQEMAQVKAELKAIQRY